MLQILNVTFPFFALVLCGYVAARRGMLSLSAIPGLNSFVLYFALPCMLFRFGASTPIGMLLDAGRISFKGKPADILGDLLNYVTVLPITLDIDNPVFRAGFDRLLAIQNGITAARKRGGLVGRLQQAGWAARGLATFARLYFVPVVHNELPSNARAVAAW
jgi:hypothetical protein